MRRPLHRPPRRRRPRGGLRRRPSTSPRRPGAPLDAVEVTGEPGEKPTLEFDAAPRAHRDHTRVIEEGDGEEIAPGSVGDLRLPLRQRPRRQGARARRTTPSRPSSSSRTTLMAGVYKGLDGVPAGSRVLVGIPPTDGLGADPSAGRARDRHAAVLRRDPRRADAADPSRGRGGRARAGAADRRAGRGRRAHHHRARHRAADRARRAAAHRRRRRRSSRPGRPSRSTTPA